VDELIAARTSLEQQRGAVLDEIRKVDRAVAALDAILSPVRESEPRFRHASVLRETLEVLIEADAPIHARDVVQRLQARGARLSESAPIAQVVTRLLRLVRSGAAQAYGRNVYRATAPPAEGGTE
jgi:hypothetical protein